MEILNWIQNWFNSQCDGDWENENQIRIETIGNPGWDVNIDLKDTSLQGKSKKWLLNDVDEHNWYGIKIENNCFEGSGDPSKLIFILNEFKKIVENEEYG